MRFEDTYDDTPALGSWARAVLTTDDPYQQAEIAEKKSARVGRFIRHKAAVLPGTTSTLPELAGLDSVGSTFLPSLRNRGAFMTALPDFMPLQPFVRNISVTADLAATTTNYGSADDGKPIAVSTALDLTSAAPEPLTASCLVVVSDEIAKSPGADAILERLIRRALPRAIDDVFFQVLTAAGADSNASAGATAEDSLADMSKLLADVGPTSESALYFAGASNVVRGLSTLGLDAIALRSWPMMGPAGGELMPGVQAVVSDALSSATAWLFDASQIGASLLDISIQRSNQTALEMKDGSLSQDGSAGTGAALVSMWQNNLLAIKATATFTVKPNSSTAAAKLTSVGYVGATAAAS